MGVQSRRALQYMLVIMRWRLLWQFNPLDLKVVQCILVRIEREYFLILIDQEKK